MILNSKIIGTSNKHLLILHGIFGMNDNWNGIGKILSENYTIHLLDLRNHGKSFHSNEMDYPLMASDVINYINFHKIEKTSIIGHSMGGKVAMQAVLDCPNYFEKAVVVDISPVTYSVKHNEVINALSSLDFSLVTKRQKIIDHLKEFIEDESVVMWLMKSVFLDESVYKLKFNLATILENYDLLSGNIEIKENKTSTIHILFLKGENSDYINLSTDLDKINSIFKNHKLVEIPNAGHWTHVDNPSAIIENIKDFFVD